MALFALQKGLSRKNKTHFMRGTYVIILKLKYTLYQIRKSTKNNIRIFGVFPLLQKKNQIRTIFKTVFLVIFLKKYIRYG